MSFIINPYQVQAAAGGDGLPVTSGLWGHWDAAEGITKDGSNNISQWDDQSGNGNHWVQTTADDQPEYIADAGSDLNNLPAVYFDRSGWEKEWMQLIGTNTTFYESGDSGAYTIFVVFTDLDASGSNLGGLISGQYDRSPATDPAIATIMIFKNSSNVQWRGWSTDSDATGYLGNIGHNGVPFNDSDPHIIGETFHGNFHTSSPESFGASIDNGTETCYPTLCQGSASGNTVAVSDFLYLNRQIGYIIAAGLKYRLAEMVLYKGALSNADFNSVENYLNTKYDVY